MRGGRGPRRAQGVEHEREVAIFDILEENRDVLDALVLELMDKETLDKEEVATVFEALRRRAPRPAWTGSPDRKASHIPPVEIPQAIRAHDADGVIYLGSFSKTFASNGGFVASHDRAIKEYLRYFPSLNASYNVLEDPMLREGIKQFSNWPTIPQLYVKGEFVGGCDIVREMFQDGELLQLWFWRIAGGSEGSVLHHHEEQEQLGMIVRGSLDFRIVATEQTAETIRDAGPDRISGMKEQMADYIRELEENGPESDLEQARLIAAEVASEWDVEELDAGALSVAAFSTLATSAVASAGPTPGSSSSRRLVSFERCQAFICRSNSKI